MADLQIVIFKSGNEYFGLDIENVREIIDVQQVFKVPEAPDFIEGLINLRNSVYTLVNLRRKFNLPSKEHDENTKIIITNSDSSIGFLVDEVCEITGIDSSAVDNSEEAIKKYSKKNISGITKVDDKTVLIIDIKQFIEKLTK